MPNNNNNENNNNSGGGGVGPGVLGMMQGAFNMLGAGQQHRRQKELMDIQFGNQQALNRQGHQLQMDMWNKTNYGAQLEHMKKAGLNPALMYGMSGGGGTTAGSQGGGVGPGVLGMMQGAFNMLGAGQQHRRQKELMDIQFGNQQALNRQGHQLQMDMWNKTNYGAQLEHMKKAGLNPALMYGMSGGGGTTAGSQGGGSASGGNAVQMHPMDMANMALIDAERKLKEAQARELDSKTGVNEAQTKKIGAEFKNVGADTIKKIQETTNLKTLDEWNGLKRDIEMMKRD